MSSQLIDYVCHCGISSSPGYCTQCLEKKERRVNSNIIAELSGLLSIHSSEYSHPPQILDFANHYYRLGLFALLKNIQMQLDSQNSEIVEKYCKKLMELNNEQRPKLTTSGNVDSSNLSGIRAGYVTAYRNLKIFTGFMNEMKLIKLKSLIRAIDNFFNQKEVVA